MSDIGYEDAGRDSEQRTFLVVVNAEEQYSVWDAKRAVPNGWSATGFEGPEDACLEHISTVWTDMRPKSLRVAHGGA